MVIKKAAFVLSLEQLKAFPGQGAPEIAMAGKSNVGKSSTINCLTRMSKLARVSSEPGKTRLVNIYSINEDEMLLVDLPGYGFAKAPRTEKKRWGAMIEGYLSKSGNLKHVLQLVDLRHAPTADDQLMVEYLRHYNLPFTVLANKCDKLSRAQRGIQVQLICRTLAVQPWEVIPFSASTGEGLEKVLALFGTVLEAAKAPESAEAADPQEK
ncbi:MAG: ribosome biogenesis GTP-binding protein YihA/YsxC [Clostridia bacterium]